MAEARRQMIIGKPAGFHPSVDDGWTAKLEAPFLQIFRKFLGERCLRRHVYQTSPRIL